MAVVNLESALTSRGPARRRSWRPPRAATGSAARRRRSPSSSGPASTRSRWPTTTRPTSGERATRHLPGRPRQPGQRDRGRSRPGPGVPPVRDLGQRRQGGGVRRRRLAAGERVGDLERRTRRSRDRPRRHPAAGRRPGRQDPQPGRRGLPALGRRGPGLPDRRPAHARPSSLRRRGRRDRRDPRPRPARRGHDRRHLRQLRPGQLPLVPRQTAGHRGAAGADRRRQGGPRRLGAGADQAEGRAAPSPDRSGRQRGGPEVAGAARVHRPRAGTGRRRRRGRIEQRDPRRDRSGGIARRTPEPSGPYRATCGSG